jgi:hypothetical protein
MDRENSEVKMEMRTRGAEMSEEARTAAVFSCEYSEQNPVYCQQCGGHEHLCRKRLNTEGLTAYFEQMATDGRVETTVQWLVEISLLIQSDVEKRLKHVHAEHSTAIRKAAENLTDAIENSKRTINHRTQVTDVYFEMEPALTELRAALEDK